MLFLKKSKIGVLVLSCFILVSNSYADFVASNDDQRKGICHGALMFRAQFKNDRDATRFIADLNVDDKMNNFNRVGGSCVKESPRLTDDCIKSRVPKSDYDLVMSSVKAYSDLKSRDSQVGDVNSKMIISSFCTKFFH